MGGIGVNSWFSICRYVYVDINVYTHRHIFLSLIHWEGQGELTPQWQSMNRAQILVSKYHSSLKEPRVLGENGLQGWGR